MKPYNVHFHEHVITYVYIYIYIESSMSYVRIPTSYGVNLISTLVANLFCTNRLLSCGSFSIFYIYIYIQYICPFSRTCHFCVFVKPCYQNVCIDPDINVTSCQFLGRKVEIHCTSRVESRFVVFLSFSCSFTC